MVSWGEGMRWEPGALSATQAQLAQRHHRLAQTADALAAATTPGWKGRAAEAAARRRELLVDLMRQQSGVLITCARAYERASVTLDEIKAAMRETIAHATAREFGIHDSGVVVSRAQGPAALDPRRLWWGSQIQTMVALLCARLTAMDLKLAADLQAAVTIGQLQGLGSAAQNTAETAVDKGMDWAEDTWDEDVKPRLDAFGTGMDRFADAAGQRPRWLDDLIDKGEVPQLSEVAGTGTYLGGLLAGAGYNAVTGKDQRMFDDGTPYSGAPRPVAATAIGGPSDLMRDMNHVYNTSSDENHSDRPSIKVTVVEHPGQPPRYVVAIPGTTTPLGQRDGWFGNNEGTDWPADLKGVGYGTSSSTEAVMQAIDKVRAQRGDTTAPEVLLTGHSQGGIIAANIAAHEGFNSRYDVKGLMSAGSPINTIPIPPEVPTLNFANRADPVAAIDLGGRDVLGNGGPPQPGVREVQLDSPYTKHDWSPTTSHDPNEYQRKIDDVMRPGQSQWTQDEAAVHEWNRQMERFYTTNGAQTSAYEIEVGRQ